MSDTIAPETTDAPATGYGFRTAVTATADTHPMIMADGPSVPPVDGPPTDPDDFSAYAAEIRTFVLQFWAPPSDAALDFLVLWIIATHLRGRDGRPFLPETFPLLFLGSTGPASGKSTALKIASELACRGKFMADYTGPALVNAVDGDASSLFLDEADTKVGQGAGPSGMRAHWLSSYEIGGTVSRAMGKSETRDVDVHYPIAFAGMVKTFITHPTLAALRTRAIMLHCRPNLGANALPTIPFRVKHRGQARAFREVMTAWGVMVAPTVVANAEHTPMPADVVNRDRQLWEVLFALADAIGGDWRARCEAACREITQGVPGEDALPSSPLEWLLRDISTVWTPGADRMSTSDIVTGLLNIPETPWDRWLEAKPGNAIVSAGKQMARILADRNGADGEPVRPLVMKINKVATRGLYLRDLLAAGMPAPVVPEVDDAPVAKPARKRTRPAPRPAHGRPAAPVVSE